MAPFTREQADLIERFVRALIQDSKPTADCLEAVTVTRIKEEMVTDPILVELLNRYKEQNNGQEETTK